MYNIGREGGCCMLYVNLRGRVNNIPLGYGKALVPLFEATINSFQSIEELNDKSDSYIKILVERDELHLKLDEFGPIQSFTIQDNGVGFNAANFKSFETSDSIYKQNRGGKGVGRFLWLKAFNSVKIDSNYFQDEKVYCRSFKFSLDEEGISNHNNFPISDLERKTTVQLCNFKPKYSEACPKRIDTIAMRIIEHCLSYFIQPNCPKVYITDGNESIQLNDFFKNHIDALSGYNEFVLKNMKFRLLHLRLYSGEETNHRMHLCAHGREVCSKKLVAYFPYLAKKIKDESNRSFVYLGYLSGEYLDEYVNQDRSDFTFEEESELDFPNYISKNELLQTAISYTKQYMDQYLEEINRKKLEQISEYIHLKSPQFLPLLKYKMASINNLSPNMSESELDIALYKIGQELELELRGKQEEFLEESIAGVTDDEEYQNKYSEFIEQLNDIGKSNLAKYVAHRRIILTLLENGLKRVEGTNYQKEDHVHKIIFPLKATSEEVSFRNQNLWVIDERLAYHCYLASDKPLNQQKAVCDSLSIDRPDLLVYNKAFAFVEDGEPFQSIVVIEFKRPGRKNYDVEEDNPISQVYRYMSEIREGRKNDKDGRPITVPGGIPFYGYIICDFSSKIKEYAEQFGLRKTPDGMGYFGFNENYQAYIEIISYNKLVSDAKKRNQVLFDSLFNPRITY
jgi:hypothetical protein